MSESLSQSVTRVHKDRTWVNTMCASTCRKTRVSTCHLTPASTCLLLVLARASYTCEHVTCSYVLDYYLKMCVRECCSASSRSLSLAASQFLLRVLPRRAGSQEVRCRRSQPLCHSDDPVRMLQFLTHLHLAHLDVGSALTLARLKVTVVVVCPTWVAVTDLTSKRFRH